MTPGLDKAVDLKYYWRLIWRRRGLILLCALTTFCSAFVTLLFVPKEYESKATMMVEDSQLLSADLEKVIGGIMQAPTGFGVEEKRLAQIVGRIRSRPFLERVVRLLKMNEDPVIRAEAEKRRRQNSGVTTDEMAIRLLVGGLQSRIRVERAGSSVYNIVVADYSAANSFALAKWVSELFVDVSNQNSLDRIRSAHQFGSEQAKIYEAELRKAEEALENYRRDLIGRGLAERLVRDDNLDRAERLDGELQAQAAGAQQEVDRLSDSLAAVSLERGAIDFSGDPRISELIEGFSSSLKDEIYKRLSARDLDAATSPVVGPYSAYRGLLQQEIEAQASRRLGSLDGRAAGISARYVLARAELEARLDAARWLQGAIGGFRRHAQATPQDELRLTRLQNDVEDKRRVLQSFRSQQVASDISQAVETTNLGARIEILDPASLPLKPVRPNVPKILLATLFLGPLIGAGLAFVAETTDPSLRTIEDFARVAPEPILGMPPLLRRVPPRGGWLRRRWVPAAIVGVVLLSATAFVTRTVILRNILTIGRAVQMTSPEGTGNADR